MLFVIRLVILTVLLCSSFNAYADISVVREVVIAPKGVNAAANIGSVNSSPNVKLISARVDINVGTPGSGAPAPLPLSVNATFELQNDSSDELSLTVGFPVSNSQYSSFKFEWFRVTSNGSIREVFRRKSSYPRQIVHEYVSGELGPSDAVPPSDIDRETMKLMGDQVMGRESFQNLMVWEEHFGPKEKKTVEVRYEIQIPLQENVVHKKKVEGSHKGIWPEEANNIPLWFLDRLPKGSFYFFDYYLTSGSSWAGPIGEEIVNVHFGSSWKGHEFHTSANEKFSKVSGKAKTSERDIGTTYIYKIKNVEPAENLYFAVKPQ